MWASGGVTPECHQFDPILGIYIGVSFNGINPPGYSPGGACFANFNGDDVFIGLHGVYPESDAIVGYKLPVIPEPGIMFSCLCSAFSLLIFASRKQKFDFFYNK